MASRIKMHMVNTTEVEEFNFTLLSRVGNRVLRNRGLETFGYGEGNLDEAEGDKAPGFGRNEQEGRPECANSSFMATTLIPGSRHGKNARLKVGGTYRPSRVRVLTNQGCVVPVRCRCWSLPQLLGCLTAPSLMQGSGRLYPQPGVQTFTDTMLSPYTFYSYYVQASNIHGFARSASVTYRTKSGTPTGSLHLNPIFPVSHHSVLLHWTSLSNDSGPIEKYILTCTSLVDLQPCERYVEARAQLMQLIWKICRYRGIISWVWCPAVCIQRMSTLRDTGFGSKSSEVFLSMLNSRHMTTPVNICKTFYRLKDGYSIREVWDGPYSHYPKGSPLKEL
ncbi:uncharacterized protein LOC142080854 [Calonectris borealis]|uniref:uncharacterized protein LOC142080854 n=1 Tax=Calonectris borealis TaxID=1323832 RepID=UPI003F4BB6D6